MKTNRDLAVEAYDKYSLGLFQRLSEEMVSAFIHAGYAAAFAAARRRPEGVREKFMLDILFCMSDGIREVGKEYKFLKEMQELVNLYMATL